ncbi:MAG: DNA gyrase inhibitor YacG [Acidobacteria bacterium]|nr:MAG: DNA gyrase inhibitor YacG [Acidobacteriota bacterium]
MRCPICKQEVPYAGNPFRPFCSERCKLIDLDNWLEGRYRVPDASSGPQDRREPAAEDNDNGDNGNDH